MLTHEEEIKVRLFQNISNNADKLCDTNRYLTPSNVAISVNNVYDELFGKSRID